MASIYDIFMVIRLGLCCQFSHEPIRFRATTARQLGKLPRPEQLDKLTALCLHNCHSLRAALHFCGAQRIGAFRILSPFLPRYTHPLVGYELDDLPESRQVLALLAEINGVREQFGLRLSLHPDQFIVLSSPRPEVVHNACRELEYQALLAAHLGADTITIHAGGAYGDKEAALKRFVENFRLLSPMAQSRLTIENDDRTYTVSDLLPVCQTLAIPLVYDVHHHRCNPDGLCIEEATQLSIATWKRVKREPYFHISSPRNGWGSGDKRSHADYIDPADFPTCWQGLAITVDVEAKAKECAVLSLKRLLL